jgi:hypothetical protein
MERQALTNASGMKIISKQSAWRLNNFKPITHCALWAFACNIFLGGHS